MPRSVLLAAAVAALGGCRTPASTLDPAGRGAGVIAELFWWMTIGGALIGVALAIVAYLCLRGPRPSRPDVAARWLIVGGGVVLPTLALVALLAISLPRLPALAAHPEPDDLRVVVSGEQWWWRVSYLGPEGDRVELANELWLPRGRRARLDLDSDNVLHAFWAPALAGKMDMIPGRRTSLTLEPTRTGVFRGLCAEYCGTSHARMAFHVRVVEPDEFAAWLGAQRRPAVEPTSPAARQGRRTLLESGCGACHAIRGTAAAGRIGPDLTHVGSRLGLAAATLPNDHASLAAWIRRPASMKPAARMPAFHGLGDERIASIAAYLGELR